MAFIYRIDKNNVGDWFSSPMKFFPFKPTHKVFDICSDNLVLNNEKIVIVGGGGLGTEYFKKYLEKIADDTRSYKLIAWGVGVDNHVDITKSLNDSKVDLHGTWFDKFDIVGTRVYANHPIFKHVPCVSCMHPLFFKYRDVKPIKEYGLYLHKDVNVNLEKMSTLDIMLNNGNSIEEKLRYMSFYECIITNTYHGVYWATLLGKKVVCIPFKTGLYSFQFLPLYSSSFDFSQFKQEDLKNYPMALESSRAKNIDFYKYITDVYGDV